MPEESRDCGCGRNNNCLSNLFGGCGCGDSSILFFIIIFLLLFVIVDATDKHIKGNIDKCCLFLFILTEKCKNDILTL